MSHYEYYDREDLAGELKRKLIKSYRSKNVPLNIKDKGITIYKDRFKFEVKILPETRVDQIHKYARDVQMALKLPLFQVVEEGTSIFVIVADEIPKNNHLFQLLRSPEYAEAKKNMGIAHPVGVDFTGKPVIEDLEKYPHAMVSGATNSGKTVSLKCLLLSLIGKYSPKKINLLICDRASDLSQFTEIPHLSYPPIDDFKTFLSVMLILQDEMHRRLHMKRTLEFAQLPAIVCVIDEFHSFITGTNDKKLSKMVIDTLSDILRMGRHVHIHLILAAHNPTKQCIRIDMSDIHTKMVFRVSKPHNSVAALGEGGAEKLRGEGDMLFSRNGDLQHLQGAFISQDEVDMALNQIRSFYDNKSPKRHKFDCFSKGRYGFIITDADLQQKEAEIEGIQTVLPFTYTGRNNRDSNDSLFAKVALWALGQTSISCNMITEVFNFGWRRANGFIKRLHDMGIVGDLDAKLPRQILPQFLRDIPNETIEFLMKYGVSENDIVTILGQKSGT